MKTFSLSLLPQSMTMTAALLLGSCSAGQSEAESPASDVDASNKGGMHTDNPNPTNATLDQAERTAVVHQPRVFPSFVDFDLNEDQEVTQDEFQAALREQAILLDWDENDDEMLSSGEFGAKFYNAWDIDGDGAVDVEEYKSGSGAYFPDADAVGTFEDYDGDGDKELTMTEFQEVSDGIHRDWDGDGDGELTDKEFESSLYEAWDLNGDGIIDHYELK